MYGYRHSKLSHCIFASQSISGSTYIGHVCGGYGWENLEDHAHGGIGEGMIKSTKEKTELDLKLQRNRQRKWLKKARHRERRKERYLWCQPLSDSSVVPFFCGLHFRYCSNSSFASTDSRFSLSLFASTVIILIL
ncbi:hypothetical protein VNO77_24441 [Canavalia gladiata]|uniref:Uncharacterized protein n=1 Tax=Canavalia gladiata TaxID=3824 RepID=A0AAN9L9K9_CANGL